MNIFWETLNEAIQGFTGNQCARFPLIGYMMDTAGGSVSCEKHFDFTVKRCGNFLQGEDLKSEFKFLCESVLKAETPLIYKRAAERMDKFIAVHSHLQLWWDWWQKCKSYVFCAFKPLYNVPKANHAEKSIHDGLRWVQGTWPW